MALHDVFVASGTEATLRAYHTFAMSKQDEYDLSEAELNTLGYQILYPDNRPGDAVRIFLLNAQEHPKSSNALDSLAEAYKVSGNENAARENYRKALQLDPGNIHAKIALAQLK